MGSTVSNQNQKQQQPQRNEEPVSACPIKSKTVTTTSTVVAVPEPSQCPMKTNTSASADKKAYKNPVVYNVYSQPIDPANKMPAAANQDVSPEQRIPLPTERVQSTIPKGGTENETWTYPSPQMFWNALARKKKLEGVAEADMDTVIAIHNNMNENTWRQ
eukprot:gene3528-4814_t